MVSVPKCGLIGKVGEMFIRCGGHSTNECRSELAELTISHEKYVTQDDASRVEFFSLQEHFKWSWSNNPGLMAYDQAQSIFSNNHMAEVLKPLPVLNVGQILTSRDSGAASIVDGHVYLSRMQMALNLRVIKRL